MSIEKSLKKRGALARARNVLKRHERIEKLQELEKWPANAEEANPYGLPKVRIYRLVNKKPKKKKEEAPADGKKKGKK